MKKYYNNYSNYIKALDQYRTGLWILYGKIEDLTKLPHIRGDGKEESPGIKTARMKIKEANELISDELKAEGFIEINDNLSANKY